ncbi:type III-B CRISPR module-associated protein Cmr5 [Fervidobacterium riparium]|uniref:CRISPR type III-B/RAMP module-associated protein Cmr5 n=1 Tax=Fervidobacterium gondwanense DSM 13020 TaxID=1121883 RepID=A0A1M7TGK8_FERGO|nr:type III-B CRISPR module-associated protein Cmr5 [Fervidobacterium gondwanense]UXF00256.1 hypothetical protein IB67_01275 [Fervidobacterium riparium]SHN69821.1 CRISPR-associated protein Cmr5 [Fervidobacterium gondwanense DSM 13020]
MKKLVQEVVSCVEEIYKCNDPKKKEKYLSTVKGLGSMIIQNGLYGTILFLLVKGHDDVVKHLDRVIKLQTGEENFSEKVKRAEALQNPQYFKIQYAALEGVKWLRRYADIYLGGEEDGK